HANDSTHDIFGEPSTGPVRLPLYSSRATTGQRDKRHESPMRNEMQSNCQVNRCWISRFRQIKISGHSNGRYVRYKRISVVRLVSFSQTVVHFIG
ncbi:hypothetical protein V1527DRAFT_382157, partial [Lipomyces starkeyi]